MTYFVQESLAAQSSSVSSSVLIMNLNVFCKLLFFFVGGGGGGRSCTRQTRQESPFQCWEIPTNINFSPNCDVYPSDYWLGPTCSFIFWSSYQCQRGCPSHTHCHVYACMHYSSNVMDPSQRELAECYCWPLAVTTMMPKRIHDFHIFKIIDYPKVTVFAFF